LSDVDWLKVNASTGNSRYQIATIDETSVFGRLVTQTSMYCTLQCSSF